MVIRIIYSKLLDFQVQMKRVVKGQMKNLTIGLVGLKQNMFLRHCPVYQGIEENYLYLKIISVVEMKIAKKKSEI